MHAGAHNMHEIRVWPCTLNTTSELKLYIRTLLSPNLGLWLLFRRFNVGMKKLFFDLMA